MMSGEDLLLLALAPRSGRIREAERVKYGLRASVLVDLALHQRITMNINRIKVLDMTATGDRRLDNALASLGASAAPSLRDWLRGIPAGFGIVNRYLSILADQGVVRIEHHRGLPAPIRVTLLDQARHEDAKARVDRVAHGRESEAPDRALAGLAHSCGLTRRLYRFSPLARARIARLGDHKEIAENAAAALAATDAVLADAIATAISDGIAQLTAELSKLLRYEYRIEQATAGGHHGTASGHHGGYGDSGSGHHHSH